MLSFITVSSVDNQVINGLTLGSYISTFDTGTLPRYVGDWSIRPIEDRRNPGTGVIVALPSNSRTRLIYLQGRRVWLCKLGYDADMATNYIRASNTVKLRWDQDVATFVFDNYNMDGFVLDQILDSSQPRKVADSHGICNAINRGKLVSGCQVIKNIRGLRKRK